ncbi:unnamed protein product, partial [marine sediment metagenome]
EIALVGNLPNSSAMLSFFATGPPGGMTPSGLYKYSPIGSFILITGQLDVDGDGVADTAYQNPLMAGYLTGNYLTTTVDVQAMDPFGGFSVSSQFDDQKNAAMLWELGFESWGNADELVPDTPDFYGWFELGFTAQLVADGCYDEYWASTAVLSGDVNNYVPIPSAVLLLGSGLFGLIGLRRKFQS